MEWRYTKKWADVMTGDVEDEWMWIFAVWFGLIALTVTIPLDLVLMLVKKIRG